MATQLQLRRGTTAENNAFIGSAGEVTVDTQTHALRVHDGSTLGGFEVDTVVFFQRPTADNNYTWARKYASGWVEQGGTKTSGGSGNHTIDLPVTMSNTEFWTQATRSSGASTTSNVNVWVRTPTSTNQITVYTSDDTGIKWEVKGIAA